MVHGVSVEPGLASAVDRPERLTRSRRAAGVARYCAGDVAGELEIVRSIFEAWNRGDIEGVLVSMGPAIKIDYTAGALSLAGGRFHSHRGRRIRYRPHWSHRSAIARSGSSMMTRHSWPRSRHRRRHLRSLKRGALVAHRYAGGGHRQVAGSPAVPHNEDVDQGRQDNQDEQEWTYGDTAGNRCDHKHRDQNP